MDRWQTVAIEAAKQSGNPFIPTIHAECPLDRFLEGDAKKYDLRLIGSLQMNTEPLYSRLTETKLPNTPSGLFLVGPEGDFSDYEYSIIRDADFVSITLGPHVLKCETAAIKALSLLQYEFSNWLPRKTISWQSPGHQTTSVGEACADRTKNDLVTFFKDALFRRPS